MVVRTRKVCKSKRNSCSRKIQSGGKKNKKEVKKSWVSTIFSRKKKPNLPSNRYSKLDIS